MAKRWYYKDENGNKVPVPQYKINADDYYTKSMSDSRYYDKQATDTLLADKVSKSDIVQSTGTSTTAVMSQKAVSDIVDELEGKIYSDVKIGDLDASINGDYDNKTIDCDFVIGKKYKVVINTDKACNISIRYNTTEETGAAVIHDFKINGYAEFLWECNTDKAKDKLYFVPSYGTYPVQLTAVLYEYIEDAIVEKVESVKSEISEVENAFNDLRDTIKVDYLERKTNYLFSYNGSIQQNSYTSDYGVAVYHLEAGKKYRLIIKDYEEISDTIGMYGFRDVPTIEIANYIVRDVVAYKTEPITGVIIEGEGQYLFTCDKTSSPNFELYEFTDIKRSVTELIKEGLAPLSEIKEALAPMTKLDKIDGVSTPNWYIHSMFHYIETNKYSSNYKVTQYELKANTRYLIKVINPSLFKSSIGMYGFSDEGGLLNRKVLVDVVGYHSTEETEFVVKFDKTKYLFTCDKTSSPNFELYEFTDIKRSVTELIKEGLAPLSEIKEALAPMTKLDKIDGVSTPNWYIHSMFHYIETNKYSSNYKVTQYELKANTRYLIKVINPSLFKSSIGMYGFSDEGGLLNRKVLVDVVGYHSTEETEFVVKFDKTKYLFTCDTASFTDNNFVVYECGGLRPIDVYVEDKIQEIKDDFVVPTIKIQIPDVVFASVGTELNIYNDGITLSIDRGLTSPMNYHTQWSCNFGRVHSRGIVFNPTAGDIGNHTCTCDIYTLSGKLIDSKTFTIKVVNPSMDTVKNILFVGDSLGTATYSQIVGNFNNAEKFSGAIKPNLYNLSNGGWHWKSYAQDVNTNQRVEVSGIGSLSVGAKYVDGENNLFEILEVNITEGSGNVLISKSYNPPYGYNNLTIPSGSLTKVGTSYSGDATFSYTNGVNEAGNPFWNASKGTLDIAKFRSDKGISEKFDMVIFQLGINSNENINTEGLVEGWITDINNAFLADNPNTIFVLGCTPTATNDYSAIGSNYGLNSRTWGIRYATNEYKFKDLYLRWGQDAVEHPNMRVIGEHLNIDRWYGYPMATRPINANTTETEEYHTNYAHPSTSGYKQLADAIFASIIGIVE